MGKMLSLAEWQHFSLAINFHTKIYVFYIFLYRGRLKYSMTITKCEKLEEPVFIAENNVWLPSFIGLCDYASFLVAALFSFVVDEAFRAASIHIKLIRITVAAVFFASIQH